MNLRFWERTTDDDEEEQDATPAPVPAVMSKAEERAARLAAAPMLTLGMADVIDGLDVLPGFVWPIRDLL